MDKKSNTREGAPDFHLCINGLFVGIEIKVPKPTEIVVSGIDKQLVGEMAARIRQLRKPEPYKGKGIRFKGEYVRRKVGKSGIK